MSSTDNLPTASKKSVSGAEVIYSFTKASPTTFMESTTYETSSSPDILDSISSTDGNYLMGSEARGALMRGVNLVNDAVKTTIGPKGQDAILEAYEWPYSIATNDGASIAERVKSADPYEQMGVRLIQESIGRANKASGDGSTTTCVLTAALLSEGQKYSSEDIKDELNAALPAILDSIDKQTKDVKPEDIWKVAAVSAQDEDMGKMIGEIYEQIGKNGVIIWDNANGEDTSYEIKDGIELKGVTFAHQSMINAHTIKDKISSPLEGDCVVMNNPHILITAEKISKGEQLEPYVSSLKKEGVNEMVLFCDEIEPIALAQIEATSIGRNISDGRPIQPFKIVVLRAPTLWKDWIYEDFALMTGATVFGAGQSAGFKGAASLSWLGTCDKIVARRGGTDIVGTQDISEHIQTLTEASKDYRDFEKRVEWLNSKSAIVRMGARSEVELTYKRLKFDDAKNAAKLALQGGIVVGGGCALEQVAHETDNPLIAAALTAPKRQIEANGTTVSRANMEELGIYDPALVVKNSVKAAISVASTVLNCHTLIPQEHQQKYA